MSTIERKSDAKTSAAAKKARLAHSVARETVESIITDSDSFSIPGDTKVI
jgi:hypothetical protein